MSVYSLHLPEFWLNSVHSKKHMIIFGETGTGKSSVINMLVGHPVTVTSDTAAGVTFQSDSYEVEVHGVPLIFHDTVGLSEGDNGTVPAAKAIEALYRLIDETHSGIHLLIYVLCGPHLRPAARKNYEMFYEMFCEKKVPLVIVITGLEAEPDWGGWWIMNQNYFSKQKMVFKDAMCIMAFVGGEKGVYMKEYKESKVHVELLVSQWYSREPWYPHPTVSRPASAFTGFANCFAFNICLANSVWDALISFVHMNKKEAVNLANEIYNQVMWAQWHPQCEQCSLPWLISSQIGHHAGEQNP